MEARQMLHSMGPESRQGTFLDESLGRYAQARWQPMLEGIQDPYQRSVMAILLENEMNHLKGLNEETLSTGVGSFTKYIFPVLRRVFPNLIANQIVSIQPMTSPIGGIFTYEYKYGDTKGSITQNQNLIQTFSEWYSSEYVDLETKVADVGAGPNVQFDDINNPTDRIPFKFLPVHAKSTAKDYVTEFSHPCNTGANVLKYQDDGAGQLVVTEANAAPADVGAIVGTINYTTGAFTLDFTLAGAGGPLSSALNQPDANAAITASYYYNSELVGTTTAPGVSATLYDTTTLGQVAKIPEVNIDITLTTVQAISRKLKARWSVEAMDDLMAFHGMVAETELVAGIANNIALELDREIIDDLVNGARFSATYNFTSGPGIGTGSNELESIRGLLTIIDAVGSKIHTGSLRAPANFIVCSPDVGALLSQLTTHGDFMMVNRVDDVVQPPSYGPLNSTFGVSRLGTLKNKYAVYQDPFLTTNKVLIGLKGQSFLDAGYVYAPYIPLQVTQTFLDPDDLTHRKGLRTRYAKKMLRPEYYGVVTVSGLPTVAG